MNTSTLIYLAEITDRLHCYLIIVSLTISICTIVFTALNADEIFYNINTKFFTNVDDFKVFKDNQDRMLKVIKLSLSLTLICSLLSVFMPSKNTVYLMAASDLAQSVVISKDMIELKDKTLKYLNSKLEIPK